MRYMASLFLAGITLGCNGPVPLPCKADIECKMDRVCEGGICVSPTIKDMSVTPIPDLYMTPSVKNLVYVPDDANLRINIIDNLTNKINTGYISGTQNYAFGIAVTSKRVFIAHPDITVIDTTSAPGRISTILGSAMFCGAASARAIAVTPDEKKAYVTCFTVGSANCNQIGVLNTQTNVVSSIITTGNGTTCAGEVAVAPDGQRAYVARAYEVAVIDTTLDKVVATIPNIPGDQGIAVSADSKKVYVANISRNDVSVIDAKLNTVITTIPVGDSPVGISITPQNTVFVANDSGNSISVIKNDSVVATVPVGTRPRGVSATSDGNKVYVINYVSRTVSVIDAQTYKVIETLPAGGSGVVGKFVSPLLP